MLKSIYNFLYRTLHECVSFSRIDLTEAGEAKFAMTLKLRYFRPQVDSPDDVSLGLKSIRPMTCNVLQQGEHSYQRCSFNSACIPCVQSLIFHAYSSSKDDEFISGESTLVEADCRRANRPSGETSWYHEAQTVFLIF